MLAPAFSVLTPPQRAPDFDLQQARSLLTQRRHPLCHRAAPRLSVVSFAWNPLLLCTLSSRCLLPSLQRLGWSVFKDTYDLKPGRIGVGVLFEPHAHFAHHTNRSHIVKRGRRYNLLQLK